MKNRNFLWLFSEISQENKCWLNGGKTASVREPQRFSEALPRASGYANANANVRGA